MIEDLVIEAINARERICVNSRIRHGTKWKEKQNRGDKKRCKKKCCKKKASSILHQGLVRRCSHNNNNNNKYGGFSGKRNLNNETHFVYTSTRFKCFFLTFFPLSPYNLTCPRVYSRMNCRRIRLRVFRKYSRGQNFSQFPKNPFFILFSLHLFIP